MVNELLLGIEKRGTDSTGIATIRGNGDIWIEKAELKASEFIKYRAELDRKIKTILLHTRYATQGHQSNLLNNHPINYNNCVIVHNGQIRNDDELFRDENLDRIAQVDSEAIAALFDKYGIEKAHLALQKLEGNFAIAAIDQRKPTALILAKGKSSPLVYYKNDSFIVWSSEGKNIINALNNLNMNNPPLLYELNSLKEGEILFIEHGKMESLEFKVKESVYANTWMLNHDRKFDNYKDSWSGWDIKDKRSDDEIRKEIIPRYGSYSVYPDAGGTPIVYRCCWDCGMAANEELLKVYDGSFYCDNCLNRQVNWLAGDKMEEKTEIDEEDEILSVFETQEHMIVCERIGKTMGITGNMVDYLLFECEDLLDGKVENQALNDIYNGLMNLYDNEMGFFDDDEEEVEESKVKKTEIVNKNNKFKSFLGL